ncbi:sodium:calcium antiporter [Pyrococcus yayanosii]|uniref:Na(+)/Ca(2+)-exchanging protein n=1 Tax=Pyrococcus yayanosii (strain CH1 / JCM 16557) TaxID=529709 RepID=F8AGR8_PYRYC|nr:sodium:calcium antiporter [Pyrococcus yayanosii]AEH25204.1 Na(+)/Ca(2+)-exchanging protein [Pyrococcus yayanosii CH1]
MFIVGLLLLIKGSDIFVEAATRVAKNFGVSEFVIALVLASIATTLPEVTVSAVSSYQGNTDVALGNAIGSALANIALILAISALIMPLKVDKIAGENSLIMLIVTLYVWFLMRDGVISRFDGLSLVLMYAAFLYYLYRKHVRLEDVSAGRSGDFKKDVLVLLLSGVMVIAGAKLVVKGAVTIAIALGVPEVVIGVTLVSIGTSLPEFANSLMATLKKVPNVSVGNIVGANILDMLMVIGVASIIRPLPVHESIFSVVMPFTLVVMALLTFSLFKNHQVSRKTAVVLLAIYVYFLWLWIEGKVYIPGG